jgi:hypothetical protein
MNEEIAEVGSVLEEEPTSLEVGFDICGTKGFDICGTNPEPELPVDQGKPRLHLNLPYVLKSFASIMTMLYCIRW